MILLVGLQVLLEHVVGRALLAPVPHNTGGALHDLSGFAFLVNLAETSPLTKLLVHWLVTVLGKNAKEGLAFIQCLGCFAKTTSKSIGNKCLLEDLLDGSVYVNWTAGHRGSGGDISFNITHVDLLDVPSNLLVE